MYQCFVWRPDVKCYHFAGIVYYTIAGRLEYNDIIGVRFEGSWLPPVCSDVSSLVPCASCSRVL